jgi:hypothetical protein
MATLLGFLWLFGGCADNVGGEEMTFMRLQEVPTSKLEALSSKSYFFAHQSVGRNILDGLRMVMKQNPAIHLNIVESESLSDLTPGTLMHANVGKNRQPESKIDEYRDALDSGLGNKVDVAFLKFCYVDMSGTREPQTLFNLYQRSIEALKAKFPKTTFVHFTLPLESIPSGLKTGIKDLIGREVPERTNNVKRAEYNQLLREAYAGKDPVFDLAHLESIDPSTGKAIKFTLDGREYEAMAPDNTSDGGHLSETGKRWIAEQLVVFLANLE